METVQAHGAQWHVFSSTKGQPTIITTTNHLWFILNLAKLAARCESQSCLNIHLISQASLDVSWNWKNSLMTACALHGWARWDSQSCLNIHLLSKASLDVSWSWENSLHGWTWNGTVSVESGSAYSTSLSKDVAKLFSDASPYGVSCQWREVFLILGSHGVGYCLPLVHSGVDA